MACRAMLLLSSQSAEYDDAILEQLVYPLVRSLHSDAALLAPVRSHELLHLLLRQDRIKMAVAQSADYHNVLAISCDNFSRSVAVRVLEGRVDGAARQLNGFLLFRRSATPRSGQRHNWPPCSAHCQSCCC
jgi:hypothetical protein